MSTIRNLFITNKNIKSLSNLSDSEIQRNVESAEFAETLLENEIRFIPQVDFSEPQNFAFYGLAEQYYEDAFKYISFQYPYDGSLKEKEEWKLSASYLDLYIFQNKYPRTNGYINLGYSYGSSNGTSEDDYESFGNNEYISFKGGPHTASTGMIGKPLYEVFSGSNLIDSGTSRQNNLVIDLTEGFGVEFWLKKPTFVSGSESARQIICDIWNGETVGTIGYGRFRVELKPGISGENDEFKVYTASGSIENSINLTASTNIDNNSWKHYAVFVSSSNNNLYSELYENGSLQNTSSNGTIFNVVTGAFSGHLGALINEASSSVADIGWGKLSGSLDEFRFWKTRRTPEQIGKYWFSQIGGGTNTDDSNTKLGIYYKFNEGITTDSSLDSVVLDYSGRVSNGFWQGYTNNSRSTSSAIVESSAATSEFLDPIIYWNHPDVSTIRESLLESGSYHDVQNNASLYNSSIPFWIRETDSEKDKFTLKKYLQSLASVFDSLHLQITELPKLHNVNYTTGSSKPYPFSSRFVSNLGIEIPDIFNKASILETSLARDDYKLYDKNLNEIKNLIYENIYNNLTHIFKSKGTENSFRNLIHCFGIGNELIKLNSYSDGTEVEFKNDFYQTIVERNFVNFNHPDRFDSTVYQWTGSDGLGSSYLDLTNTFSKAGASYTIETIFPKKFDLDSDLFFNTPFVTSSVFGLHSASTTQDDLTWSSTDDSHFRVLCIKTGLENKDAYFILSGNSVPVLTSSIIPNVYDNTKWNFFINFIPNFPTNGISSGSTLNEYKVEFIGINKSIDITENYFKLTGTVSNYIPGQQTLYCGAHRTNFTGSIIEYSDIKAANIRVFAKYLTDEEIDVQSRDSSNFGTKNVSQNFLLDVNGNELNINNFYSRILDWNFDQVSSSGDSSDGLSTTSDAYFDILDISSGSNSNVDFGTYNTELNTIHPARGDFFLPFDENSIQKEYLQVGKQSLPEVKISSNMVEIRDQNDEAFTFESRPIKTFFSFEKSYNHILSEEIMKYFASIADFNNLIGDPVNKYRPDYKVMSQMRRLYFDKFGEKSSFEKFIDFFKWIDNSVNIVIQQLIPASAYSSETIRNVIENHILQRNKYFHKFPTLEFDIQEPEAGIKGINELLYSANSGTAPVTLSESDNILWWEKKAEKDSGPLSSGDSVLDSNRQLIFQPIKSSFSRNQTTYLNLSASQPVTASGIISSLRINNIKNENALTSSTIIPTGTILGNYNKTYEILTAPGRKGQNRSFVRNNGFINNLNIANFLTGVVGNDYAKPDRSSGSNESVFVERFNSPGGPESMAESGMDSEAAEYSPYSAINFRNFTQRKNLNLSQSVTQSLDLNNPSLHKSEQASYQRLVKLNNTIITGTFSNNDNFIHELPGSDKNYAWITSSIKNDIQPYGYRNTNYSIVSGSDNQTKEKFDFVSASEVIGNNGQQYFWNSIDTSSNTVSITSSSGDSLNQILLGNEEQFGYSWKSIRKNDHPIVQYFRNNNIISLENGTVLLTGTTSGGVNYNSYGNQEGFTNYRESLINDQFKPIKHTVIDRETQKPIVLQYSLANELVSLSNINLKNKLGIKNCRTTMYDKVLEFYKDTVYFSENNPIQGVQSLIFGQTVWPRGINNSISNSRKRQIYEDISLYDTLTGLNSNGFFGVDENYYSIIDSNSERDIGRQDRNIFWKDNILLRTLQSESSIVPLIGEPARESTTIIQDTTLYNSQGIQDGRSMSLWPLATSLIFTSSFQQTTGSGITGAINLFRNDDSGELVKHTFSIVGTSSSEPVMLSLYEKFFGGRGTSAITTLPDNAAFLHPTASLSFYYVNEHTSGTNTSSINADANEYLYHFTNIKPRWRANIEAGKNPWYNSYNEYASDISFKSKGMSLIPEFNISEHINYYVDQKGGNFRSKNNRFLTLKGAKISASANSETGSYNSEFFTNFIYSDDIFNFDNIIKDHNGLMKPKKIKLTCKGIKKLLPYNGFYPQNRTIQLGTLLSQSMSDYISGDSWINGNVDPNAINPASASYSGALAQQVLLQPLMAPGILFNSIKSGIAVDWPIFTGSNFIDTSNLPFLTKHPNYRLPFETIIDLKNGNGYGGIPIAKNLVSGSVPENDNKRIYLLAPESKNYGTLDTQLRTPYFSWNGNRKPLFELATNNFIAETVNFFLEGNKMKSFISRPEKEIVGKFISGNSYYMDIILRKSPNLVMIEHSASMSNPITINSASSYVSTPYNGTGSFDGQFFGPSFGIQNAPTSSEPRVPTQDPAPAAYTPPYFYGENTIRVKYTADGSETQNGTLSKILSSLTYENINDELFDRIYSFVFDKVTLNDASARVTAQSSFIWKNRMNVTASVNIKGILRTNKIRFGLEENISNIFNPQTSEEPDNSINDRWVISPKWESPVLDFSEQEVENVTIKYVEETDTDLSTDFTFKTGRGMWSGYGKIPTGSQGIFLELKESFPDNTVTTTGSLIEVFGFNNKAQKIGEIAKAKEISEAIVAIPFVDNEITDNVYANTVKIKGHNFFKVTRQKFDAQLQELKSTSISDFATRIKNYILPPELDFVTYNDIQPFVMYLFEFKHQLDQDDLKDIWQGLMPKISMQMEEDEINISHEFGEDEFFEGKELPNGIRWMIFKIKKRAAQNYYEKTLDSQDDNRFKFDFKIGNKTPEYSYNWPYDFCSLVEMAKVDVEVELNPEEQNQKLGVVRLKRDSVNKITKQ